MGHSHPTMLITSIALSLSLCFRTWAMPHQRMFGGEDNGQWFMRNEDGGLSATDGGLLSKFHIHSDGEMDVMLSLVEEYNLDVWQRTSTRVDIFTPSNSEIPSKVLDNFPFFELNPIPVARRAPLIPHPPAFPSPPMDRWNMTSLSDTTFHSTYHPIFEIDEFMHTLATLHPDKVTLVSLGHSAQGREMYVLRIASPSESGTGGGEGKGKKGKKKGRKGRKVTGDVGPPADWEIVCDDEEVIEDDEPTNEDGDTSAQGPSELARRKRKGKQAFVLTGAQHAREWVASASALYLAHALAADPKDKGSLSRLLKNFEFHIIPIPNPDGYVYTWENDRFWYKNRMVVDPEEPCQGLDMNRNWGYEWSPSITSDPRDPIASPCSFWYPGHRPFEAPEVNSIANYIQTNIARGQRAAFVDLRSYGQMLSTPFSFSCDALAIDAENLIEAAINVEFSVKKQHGTVFTSGRLCETLYSAPGNILDWMYGEAGFVFAYAAHLRDTGTYGFALPEKWIRPVGEETGTIVKTLVNFMEFVWRM